MNRRALPLGLIFLVTLLLAAASAQAAAPRYDIKATWGDTNLTPGGAGQFVIQARNIGDATGDAPLTITDHLPPAVTITAIDWHAAGDSGGKNPTSLCSGVGTKTLSCTVPSSDLATYAPAPGLLGGGSDLTPSGYLSKLFVDVVVDPAASGTQTNTATISGGGAATPASDVDQVPFSAIPSSFGLVPGSFEADFFDDAFPFGSTSRQAGAHPSELRVNFDLNQKTGVDNREASCHNCRYITANGLVKDVEATLPRGMIGNPEALPKCDPVLFASEGSVPDSTACPADTQVGYLNVSFTSSSTNHGSGGFNNPNALTERVAIYNLAPPKGVLADFGFQAGGFVQGHIYGQLDPTRNYAIKTVTPDISSFVTVRGAQVTFWGVPADPSHDKFRFYPKKQENGDAAGAPWGSAPIRPFFTNPMDCGADNGATQIRLDSYENPGDFTPVQESGSSLNVTKCDDPRFRFEPSVALQPTDRHAGGPTGLDVNLKIPQRNDEVEDAADLYPENGDVKAIGTPPMKRVVVTLPEGMTVSPSAAQGLEACTPEEIGIDPATGVPNGEPVRCPDASQFGTLRLKSPALPQSKTIEGRVYVAQPYTNPFGSFLALYLAIEDEDLGLQVKLAGEVKLDPQTGQITTEFSGLPQLPASEVEVSIKGGLRAGLVNPQTCGTKTIEATFYSWQDPSTPHTVKNSYDVTQNPDGSPCFEDSSERPFAPSLEAGTVNPLAGAFSPIEIDMARTDIDQELSAVSGTAPKGLLASLKGTTRCTDAAIAAAENPSRTGTEELNSPSCPASSQVGTVDAGAGVGQVLTYVKGKVYLAGPYEGAPLSGVAIVPAVAGPFDLGTVVTRAPAYVDPETAQLTLKTDPLPQIFKGVPVRVRDIRVHLDRPNFTLNPTSCEEMHIGATLLSAEGKSKDDSNRFQVGSCAELGFKPKISLKLKGATKRGGHPGLRAEVRPRAGDANIASASVTLPHSAFLDQAHIRTICTRVQFAANSCPAGSVYGKAKAFTPLLDEPLEGPVYLRSSNHNLPDLVIALHGPPSLPIEFDLDGRVDSVHGGIRNTFEATPDAPVSKFVLEMEGGKKGLVVNSTNLCAKAKRATAKLSAHNGKRSSFKPEVVAVGCGKGHKRKGQAGRGSRSGHKQR